MRKGGDFAAPGRAIPVSLDNGVLRLTPVELAALFDGIDWRRVQTPREIPKPSAPA
jgi:hypothetical protein